jgi:hypothetical protein
MRIIEIFDPEKGVMMRLKLDGEEVSWCGPDISDGAKSVLREIMPGLAHLMTTDEFYAPVVQPEDKPPRKSKQKKLELMARIADMQINTHIAIECDGERDAGLYQQAACAAGKQLFGQRSIRTWVDGNRLNLLRIK